MRKISFWLASLLHEKWGRRKPAQEVGEKIAVDNKIWNEEYGEPYCFKCKNKNLVEDIRGSEGVFSWTTTVYRCAKCGNIQKKSSKHRYLFEDLDEVKITEDDPGKYRYMILSPSQWSALCTLLVFAFAVAFVVAVSCSTRVIIR